MTPEETKQAAAGLSLADDTAFGITFANRDDAIQRLCLMVFRAKPIYKQDTPAPEPMEVEVLYHPATRDFMRSDRLTHEHARQLGWTLRRATIHPETP